MEFKEWFCLNFRDSFAIDPKINRIDSKFYFGRDKIKEQFAQQIKRSFLTPGVPKLLIFGPYGSGKTQTLFHIGYMLENEKPTTCKEKPYIVQFDIEMRSKSNFRDWHLQLMESLGKDTVVKWIQGISSSSPNFETELNNVFQKDANMVSAGRGLSRNDLVFTAWRWLSGYQLSTKELESLNVTRNLGDVGVGDMVNVLMGIGNLAKKNGERLIFLIDEAEQFRNVGGGEKGRDAMESLHDYMRKLAETSNKEVGYIIAGQASTIDDMPEWYIRSDILGRIGRDNVMEIPHLPAVTEVKTFIKQLLEEFIDRKKVQELINNDNIKNDLGAYPFDDESFELLCEYAAQDPEKTLPRNIIRSINECAIDAWDSGKRIIDSDVVNNIAPLIFG